LQSFFRLFWKISLLQKGPQDVPPPMPFLVLLFVTLVITAAMVGGLYDKTVESVQVESVNAVIMTVLVAVFLYLRNHGARFNQTMSAIFGIGILFNLFTLGLALIDKLGFLPGFLHLQIELLLVIWQITVIGHILRHAMEIHIAFAILIAILFLFINMAVVTVLAPVAS